MTEQTIVQELRGLAEVVALDDWFSKERIMKRAADRLELLERFISLPDDVAMSSMPGHPELKDIVVVRRAMFDDLLKHAPKSRERAISLPAPQSGMGDEVERVAIAMLESDHQCDADKFPTANDSVRKAIWEKYYRRAEAALSTLPRAVLTPEQAAEHAGMLEALKAIRQYGRDTLSGRADGGLDDREWQRQAVIEMTKRARIALAALNRATDGDGG